MRPVLEMIERIGPSDANVLLTGENGTGKGTVAQRLHAVSQRAARPLVTVNVGGLSEGVFESELFGHVKGAFTDAKADRIGRFEMADGGTLFLDEIANLPLNLQAKLLRVVETGEFEPVGSSRTRRVDVRLVSATNADLHAEVAAGRFRQDLLFRLNTIEIHLPPLRERSEDIAGAGRALPRAARPALPQGGHGLRRRRRSRSCGATPGPATSASWTTPSSAAVLMATGGLVTRGRPRAAPRARRRRRARGAEPRGGRTLLIQKTLARCDGNVSRAAEALGLSRSALYRRHREARALSHALAAARRSRTVSRPWSGWRPSPATVVALLCGSGAQTWPSGLRLVAGALPGRRAWRRSALAARRARRTTAADAHEPAGRPARGRLLVPRARRPAATMPSATCSSRSTRWPTRCSSSAWGRPRPARCSSKVMEEIDVAVFAFDDARPAAPGQPRAARRCSGSPASALLGRDAPSELGLAEAPGRAERRASSSSSWPGGARPLGGAPRHVPPGRPAASTSSCSRT